MQRILRTATVLNIESAASRYRNRVPRQPVSYWIHKIFAYAAGVAQSGTALVLKPFASGNDSNT